MTKNITLLLIVAIAAVSTACVQEDLTDNTDSDRGIAPIVLDREIEASFDGQRILPNPLPAKALLDADAVEKLTRAQEDGGDLCITEHLTGPSSCKALNIWKEAANNACKSAGAELVDIDYGKECDARGSATGVIYTCCK